jgi:Ca2+-binding RTX toxin-like protein
MLRTRKDRPLFSMTRLALEQLEARLTPSVTLQDDIIVIHGSANPDIASVSRVFIGGMSSILVVVDNGATTTFSGLGGPRGIRGIQFFGHLGNDHFVNNTNIGSVAHGGAGNDHLVGGSGRDTFHGGDDDDFLFGNAGNDQLNGNGGRDHLFGLAGHDTLNGGDDGFADHLEGGAGHDQFQMEGYGTRGSPFYYFNRDDPVDFNPAEDSFFGEDELVATMGGVGGIVDPLGGLTVLFPTTAIAQQP